MQQTVRGKSVLVTGGGSGIGAAVVRRLAAHGATVTFAGRRTEKLRQVAESVEQDHPGACRIVTGDVTDPEDRQRMVDQSADHGGGIDIVVHSAGNMYRGALDEIDGQRMLDLFASNAVAPVVLTGLALPYLRERRGSVVFFGSVHTVRAFPGASPYAATKGALEALTGVLAAELGPQGVRVNCVRPGGVPTEINVRAGLSDTAGAEKRLQQLASAHALGRIGTPDEVAEAVEYLAVAQWTTGSVLTVDGGLGLGVTNA